MEDLSLLGNAAAVPIIIALTQFLKRNFNFKRKSEVLSLFVSVGVCLGWEFYNTPDAELIALWGGGIISTGKHVLHLIIVSCATWLSASKAYDFILGEKRTRNIIQGQRDTNDDLQRQLDEFHTEAQPDASAAEEDAVAEEGDPDADPELDKKVRDILDRE